jgi:predicted transcriptional regulator
VPAVNIYLSEEEYVKLAHLALEKRTRTSLLARQAVQKMLREQEAKTAKKEK